MLQHQFLPLRIASSTLELSPPGLLGVMGFPDLPDNAGRSLPSARTGMRGAGADTTLCELWLSSVPAHHAHSGNIRYATSGGLLFGALSSAESQGLIEVRAQAVYEEIFALLDTAGHRHALRFWNHIPRINDHERGIERYRLFNMGRQAAFERAGRFRTDSIPAASALGTGADDDLTVYFVAANGRGMQIENPRQVQAWQYPAEHGPRSPTFARAAAYPGKSPTLLFVSGTASIVGHRTLHAGDVAAQTRETLANLEAVFAQANRCGNFPIRDAAFKAYVRNAADLACIQAEIASVLGSGANVTYLKADICRVDLLVEIEAFAQAAVPESSGSRQAGAV